MKNSETSFPIPRPTAFTQRFWEACQHRVLEVYACRDCYHLFLPGGPICPKCWSANLTMEPVSGRGEIFSFVVYRRTYHPAIPAPYIVALIQLDEGPRLVSNVVGLPIENTIEEVTIGMRVQVQFDVEDNFVLPRFKPLKTDSK